MNLHSVLAALLLSAASHHVVASPQATAAATASTSTPTVTPSPTANIELREAAPSFTGVSIKPFSFTGVSITPVSITPVSISLNLPTSTCTQTIKPDKNGYVPPGECGALWNYYPSFAAAVAASFLFGATLVLHIGQAVFHKIGFCWVVIMACIWEFGSFVTRTIATHNQQSTGLATISQILVLLAPLWVNAFDYMVFARMIHFFSPSRSVFKISPSVLAFIFVTLDIGSFIIQLIGGGMAVPTAPPETIKKGLDIYMGGLGLQEFFIVVFSVLMIKFHRDMLQAERNGTLNSGKTNWRPLLFVLYASLTAITVRVIFRLVEFSAGNDQSNPLPHKEGYFYGFDFVPMFIAIILWNVVHPGRYLQGPDAKLPPSIIRRKLCCCCGGRKHKQSHQQLEDRYSEEELRVMRTESPASEKARRSGRG